MPTETDRRHDRMAGRRKVTTSYRKVERVKPKRNGRRPQEPPQTFSDRVPPSPMTTYIEENRASGLSIHELVEQFQEYDCEHRWYFSGLMPSPTEPIHFLTCEICALTERRKGRGPKNAA